MRKHAKVVGAAYEPSASLDAWLDRLASEVQPLLGGTPVVVYRFAKHPERGVKISNVVARGGDPAQVAVFVTSTMSSSARFLAHAYFDTPQITTLSDVIGARRMDRIPLRDLADAVGVRDFFSAKAIETDGSGVGVGGLLSKRRSVSDRDRWDWERVTAHVAASARLRGSKRRRSDGLPAGTEAVIDPRRGVLHAEGPARANAEALAESARRRKDGRDLDLWPALVEGRWSLVDHIEADGRRFVLARENTPGAPGPRALSVRERQVAAYASLGQAPKLIAYELGIAESTVRTLLARAKRKLGARTNVELASLAWTPAERDDELGP